jgi:hypothetical protein
LQDIKYNSNYDIEVYKDIKIATPLESEVQNLKIRMIGTNPDFILHKDLCASLSDFVGCYNNATTGSIISNRIMTSLTKDKAFSADRIKVDTYPVDEETLESYIEYTAEDDGKSETIYESQVISL